MGLGIANLLVRKLGCCEELLLLNEQLLRRSGIRQKALSIWCHHLKDNLLVPLFVHSKHLL